ncbi:GNAT family N-acetyltransferase [Pontibacillus yanchengensis]|uniref:GNAT family acetyltransferase n=1 Tax=Pontibacillus yanchengensis Y32 TaxID=1385514 RepID=A0A0A2T7J1_9BACI|nr:GNAT family N-acetyltransferase [Pontibacillus yanchengensis]KGP71772.1 GNAT family acetyltransferase [Pontibacillus yanchengensis Y32]
MEWKLKSYSELTKEQLYTILAERIQVFVVEQNCPYPEIDGYDQQAHHLWLEEEGKIVAYCRLFQGGIKYKEASIGRIFVHKDYRGKRYAREMLHRAISLLTDTWGEKGIKIQAQHYLLEFYQSLGFKEITEVYMEDGIPHLDMVVKT